MLKGELGKAVSGNVCIMLPFPACQDAFLHRVMVANRSLSEFFFFFIFYSLVINRLSVN